jgi:hypothetical protein
MKPVGPAACFAVLALLIAGCGPIGPFPGGRLRGELVVEPVTDWSFTDEHMTIAVETRPGFPHSVTTICFVHEGQLYVPSLEPRGKKWPYYILDNPNVRLKIGDKVYPGRAVRVTDLTLDDVRASAAVKYPRLSEQGDELPEIWLYRIDPRG